MTETDSRAAIVAACRAMNATGLNHGMSGNISVRRGEAMLITPTATPYERMRPADIAVLNLDDTANNAIGPLRPSSEWRFHRDLLRARPDIGALVHAHPAILHGFIYRAPGHSGLSLYDSHLWCDDVRCGTYETFGTEALSAAVVAAMSDRFACLMANHGMLAAGRDLDQAMWRATELEALAQQYHLATAVGGAVLLQPASIADARNMFISYRPR